MPFNTGDHVHWIHPDGTIRTGIVIIAHPGMPEVTVHEDGAASPHVTHQTNVSLRSSPPAQRR